VTATRQVRIHGIEEAAHGIRALDLRALDGGDLPPFSAGGHIDLHLPNGLLRSYSLVNAPDEHHRYVIAVSRDAKTRGGSAYVHDKLGSGDVLTIGAPRNNFALVEDAGHSVLLAGGIGITPLWCMIQRLATLGRSWELHYGARDRRSAAFAGALLQRAGTTGNRVQLYFEEDGGARPDVAQIVAKAGGAAHLYCCGPLPMLAAFEAASASHAPDRVHVEYFAAREAADRGGAFTVALARSGVAVEVPRGKTILDALLEAGIEPIYSCAEGVCGTCETTVLEGVPDHRDLYLSKAERATNRVMMICCSGCRGERLVLDL
jgi:vanillate O-demethylase ferredoxin subunit